MLAMLTLRSEVEDPSRPAPSHRTQEERRQKKTGAQTDLCWNARFAWRWKWMACYHGVGGGGGEDGRNQRRGRHSSSSEWCCSGSCPSRSHAPCVHRWVCLSCALNSGLHSRALVSKFFVALYTKSSTISNSPFSCCFFLSCVQRKT